MIIAQQILRPTNIGIDLLCSQKYQGNSYGCMREWGQQLLIRRNCRSLNNNILGGQKSKIEISHFVLYVQPTIYRKCFESTPGRWRPIIRSLGMNWHFLKFWIHYWKFGQKLHLNEIIEIRKHWLQQMEAILHKENLNKGLANDLRWEKSCVHQSIPGSSYVLINSSLPKGKHWL
jgi:hypothetical protein